MALRRTICALALGIAFTIPVLSARADEDRRTQQGDKASKELKKKTEEQLLPSQKIHEGLKEEHLKKAEEARQNKDEGTAQREEQMAMMEQMKVQQLQQQIQSNNESADKNAQGAAKLTETDANDKQKSYDPSVVSVRKGEVPSAPGQKPSGGGSPPGTEPAAPPAQLADLSTFSREALPQPAVVAPKAEAPPPAARPQTIDHLLGDLEKVDRAAVVYEDGAKNANGGQSGATPQYRLLTSASGQATTPTATVSGGSSDGGAGGANSDIWKAEAEKPTGGRAVATRGPASVGGSTSALEGEKALGALDKDFFEPCPDAKEWKKMSKEARGGVRDSCQKLAKQCQAKPADKKAPKGTKPKELAAECKEWLGQKSKTEKKTAAK